jgi:hypothetical protein
MNPTTHFLLTCKCPEDNNHSEHGPSVPNSLLANKGTLVNVQNLHVQAQLLERAMIRKPTKV